MNARHRITVFIFLLPGFIFTATSQAGAQTVSQPIIIGSTETGLTLTWTPPAYSLTTIKVAGVEYSQVRIPLTSPSAQPGSPELPLYSGLVGLPPAGEARLHVMEVEREIVALPHPPLPALSPQAVELSPTEVNPLSIQSELMARLADPAVYSIDTFYPADEAQIGSPQRLRDRRVAALTIYPARVNPVRNQMEIIRFIRLEITFTQPAPATAALSGQAAGDPLSSALRSILLNPESAGWKDDSARGGHIEPGLNATSTEPTFKVKVAEAGLYALTFSDLQNAGLPVNTLNPRTLKLSHGYPRQDVAILVEGEADGVFNSGDRLLFYAEPVFSRYVDYDIYFLSYGGANGLRMGNRSRSPAGLSAGTAWRVTTAEANVYYDPLYPERHGDYWYWDKLFTPDQTSRTYNLQIDKPLTSGPNATLKLWLQGYTDPVQNPDHQVRAKVNGVVAGDITWNGKQAITATLTIASSALINGQNQINLSLPGSGAAIEGTWVSALAITYPTNQATTGQLRFQGQAGQKSYTLTGWSGPLSIYDITNPLVPQRVTGFSLGGSTLNIGDASANPADYLVVPDSQVKTALLISPSKVVNDPPSGADYVIITPPSLAGAIAPLAAYRAGQGLRVITADIEAIYDTYGQGRMDATAIKTFLQRAYTAWPGPAPLYVLLVGDGSYDFKNYSGFNPQTLLPPYLAQVDPWWGETAADNQLVTLAGPDNLPDMLIGRFSANTPTEVSAIVDKVIQYETNPTPGYWNAMQLFVAADEEKSYGIFRTEADEGYNKVQSPFWGNRLYYDNIPTGLPYVFTDVNELRSHLFANFNNGASLVTFHGHSSWHQWAVESLLHLNDLDLLNNQYRLPVVLEMTCFTGFFHHPEYPTLDESFLRRSGGGAIAVWGSTGLGVSTGHVMLQAGFLDALNHGETKVGAAMLAGKAALLATGFNLDLLDTMTLFGDPALKLYLTVTPINYTNQVYLPLVSRN